MPPRSRHKAHGLSVADSDSDSSSDDDRVRAPSAAFMADYLRGPTRRRPARSPSPPAMARAGAAPLAPPPRPQQRYAGADVEYELQERRVAPPPVPQMPRAARVAAPALPAPPAVSRPLAPPPAPRAARAAPAAPERLPEPPSGGAFAPAASRRPTRPVSPLPSRGAAASDAARYLSALAAFGGGGARGGPAGADDGDGHSTPGSFTPSEASDDDHDGHAVAHTFGGGKAPPSYDYRDAVQHRHDVRPPPSELGDDDAYNDSGSESGVGEAASDDSDAGGTHPRQRQVYGGDDADFSDVSLEGAEEQPGRRAPPAQAAPAPQLTMKPLPSPLAAWDVFRGALGAAPPRPQPVRVLPAAPQPQPQQRPLPPPPQQRPRAVSAAPAARFGRDRSASPPRRPASPRGVPAPMASPAPSAALAAPRPASAVWAPPDIAPDEHTEAPLRTGVLIVDPATEWRALAAAAAALGHVPVAVLAAVGDDPALSATAAALAAPGGDRGAFALVLRARSAGGGRDVYSLAEEARNAASVARLRWVAVLPGGRAGVESADVLAAMLGLRHAPLATVAARRDKAALGDALAAAGVPRVPASPCRWPEDAWRFGCAAGYPILLRDPVQEGPEAGAWLCRTDAQAGAAVGRAMQLTRDPAMRRRRYVLAERCISGDAFLAGVFAMPGGPPNDASVDRIYVTDLWHFQPHRAAEALMDAAARELEAQAARKAAPAGAKAAAAAPGARERERARASAGALNTSASGASSEPVLRRAGGTASAPYDQAVLVDATLPEYAELVSHARRVAAAAGLAHGPGHVKLRCEWTPGRGASRPLAVLFSPTFAPGGFAALAAAAGDDDTVHPGEAPAWDPFAAAVAAAGAGGHLPEPPEPQPRLHARIVFVAAPPVAGRLTAWDGEDAVRSMRSYESHELLAKPGDRVAPVPEPGRNALAAVRLVHEDWEVIEADTAAVLSGALRVRITPGGAAGAQSCNQQ